MHGESRMVCQLGPHLRVLMSAVVVGNDMHIQVSGDALVDLLEKGKEFLMAISGFAVGEYCALCGIQGCKELCRAMVEVVMSDSFHIPQAHGQYGLGRIECLDL